MSADSNGTVTFSVQATWYLLQFGPAALQAGRTAVILGLFHLELLGQLLLRPTHTRSVKEKQSAMERMSFHSSLPSLSLTAPVT